MRLLLERQRLISSSRGSYASDCLAGRSSHPPPLLSMPLSYSHVVTAECFRSPDLKFNQSASNNQLSIYKLSVLLVRKVTYHRTIFAILTRHHVKYPDNPTRHVQSIGYTTSH
jgi:hypothetical protein